MRKRGDGSIRPKPLHCTDERVQRHDAGDHRGVTDGADRGGERGTPTEDGGERVGQLLDDGAGELGRGRRRSRAEQLARPPLRPAARAVTSRSSPARHRRPACARAWGRVDGDSSPGDPYAPARAVGDRHRRGRVHRGSRTLRRAREQPAEREEEPPLAPAPARTALSRLTARASGTAATTRNASSRSSWHTRSAPHGGG